MNIHRILRRTVYPAMISALLWTGCTVTREPVRAREDYFQPVVVIPKRTASPLNSGDIVQLKEQLEAAVKSVNVLRDSLAELQRYAGTLVGSARTLVDKVSELESREYLSANTQKELRRNIDELRSENARMAQEMAELKASFAVDRISPPRILVPGSLQARSEYPGALILFLERKYERAMKKFEELAARGIGEDLEDNCYYWIGECRFALHDYPDAIAAFRKVLAMPTSNKLSDAYFMLGQSFEHTGKPQNAKEAFEELNTRYPGNVHARAAKRRIDALTRLIPDSGKSHQKKTSA